MSTGGTFLLASHVAIHTTSLEVCSLLKSMFHNGTTTMTCTFRRVRKLHILQPADIEPHDCHECQVGIYLSILVNPAGIEAYFSLTKTAPGRFERRNRSLALLQRKRASSHLPRNPVHLGISSRREIYIAYNDAETPSTTQVLVSDLGYTTQPLED